MAGDEPEVATAPTPPDGSGGGNAPGAEKDYDLKVSYLVSHFTRMWTRFNYFVVIESALLGGKTFFGEGHLDIAGALLGLGLSLLWYVMGAEDRYLVVLYRDQLREACKRLGGDPSLLVGYVPDVPAWKSLLEWRIPMISTTRLAALVPLLVSLVWLGVLMASLAEGGR